MRNRLTGYTSEQIRHLLTALARRLDEHDVSAEIYLVGGAAMALEYNSRRTTRVIDAVYSPEHAVSEAAHTIAEEFGLDPAWLNNAAGAWIPDGRDDDATSFAVAKNLSVKVASPRNLLAMKLSAGRDQDIADIAVLCQTLGIDTAEEAVKVAFQLYGEDSVRLSDADDLLLVAQEALDTMRR